MGMSTYVQGVRDLDGRFAEMVRVKKACETAILTHWRIAMLTLTITSDNIGEGKTTLAKYLQDFLESKGVVVHRSTPSHKPDVIFIQDIEILVTE